MRDSFHGASVGPASPVTWTALIVAALVWLCTAAPAAAAPAVGSVTIVGETGSYVAGGQA